MAILFVCHRARNVLWDAMGMVCHLLINCQQAVPLVDQSQTFRSVTLAQLPIELPKVTRNVLGIDSARLALNIHLFFPVLNLLKYHLELIKFDARRIAIAHRDGRLKPSVIAPREILELRRAPRGLLRLIEEQTKCKQRINQFLYHYDCTLPQQVRGFLRNQWSLKLLQACVT